MKFLHFKYFTINNIYFKTVILVFYVFISTNNCSDMISLKMMNILMLMINLIIKLINYMKTKVKIKSFTVKIFDQLLSSLSSFNWP